MNICLIRLENFQNTKYALKKLPNFAIVAKFHRIYGQSYKRLTSVNYDPRVVTWAIF